MKRIFHHYLKWEDLQAGMWASINGSLRQELLREAIAFTGDAELYGSYMNKILTLWPISCEHNLTDTSQNRKAWIGHAATCLALGCPEDITRQAWAELSVIQQDAANAQAQAAINKWEKMHEAKNIRVSAQMEIPGIPGRDTGRGESKIRSVE